MNMLSPRRRDGVSFASIQGMRLGQLVLASLMLATMFSVLGCSTLSTPVSVVPSGDYGNLSGNWLIAGNMPSGLVPTTSSFSVTANLSVTGNQVSGLVVSEVPCSTPTEATIVVQGSIADDGTFTLTTPSEFTLGETVTLQGKVPSLAGGSWSGTYTDSFAPQIDLCSTPTQTIQATPIAPLTGTYQGTAVLYGNPAVFPGTSVPFSVPFQQGVLIPPVPPGQINPGSSYVALSGGISVSNSSCLNSGTISPSAPIVAGWGPGVLSGANFYSNFVMNDGSISYLVGQINTQDSSVLTAEFFVSSIPYSSCNQTVGNPIVGNPPVYQTVTMTRVP